MVMSGRMNSVAFTLIEVTAALAIIAATLVALVEVRGRLTRQAQHAARVAQANVLAGRLVAEWKNGRIQVEMGQQQKGEDGPTGLYWQLSGIQQEVDPGIFLKCLKVGIYADQETQNSIVSFDAWQPLQ